MALNKSSLNQEREKLARYRRYLPSLDLKKKQLTAALMKARRQQKEAERALEEAERGAGERLPMLASEQFDLSGLVTLDDFEVGDENRMGVHLPVLRDIRVRVADYSFLAQPHWVDRLAKDLEAVIRKRLEARVARQRVERLEQAVQKITQRVNLFEKVLIPEAEENIHKIEIALGDAERAAVVRSKIAKGKHAEERAR